MAHNLESGATHAHASWEQIPNIIEKSSYTTFVNEYDIVRLEQGVRVIARGYPFQVYRDGKTLALLAKPQKGDIVGRQDKTLGEASFFPRVYYIRFLNDYWLLFG